MRVFLITRERLEGGDQVRVRARLEWGGQETLDPTDVGLTSLDFIQLQYSGRRAGSLVLWPVASLSLVLGTPSGDTRPSGDVPVSIARGRRGSAITLTWTRTGPGTDPSRFGTRAAGTKSAFAEIIGRH